MDERFPSRDFDAWAPGYDQDVRIPRFPFLGYSETLERVIQWAEIQPGMRVLDLGCGTAALTSRFASLGCQSTGVDFSPKMIEIARRKFPSLALHVNDIRAVPKEFKDLRFDRIVSTYAFHHFSLPEKCQLLKAWAHVLNQGGFFIIGDISFPNPTTLEKMKKELGEEWEEEEYWIADETIPYLTSHGFKVTCSVTSSCAAVYKILSVHQ